MAIFMTVKNVSHPVELNLVRRMLDKEGLETKDVDCETLSVILPSFEWFSALSEAIHFMTGCKCTYNVA